MPLEPAPRKLFLGGYRSIKNGAEYHHATTQTVDEEKPKRENKDYSSETRVKTAINCATKVW
jgi:hypothetical protein